MEHTRVPVAVLSLRDTAGAHFLLPFLSTLKFPHLQWLTLWCDPKHHSWGPKLPSRSLGVMVNRATPAFTPWFPDPYILSTGSILRRLSLTWHFNYTFRSSFYCIWLLLGGVIHDMSVNFLVVGLLPYLLCCKVGTLVRGFVVWDSMPVDQALYKTPASDAGWGLMGRKANTCLWIPILLRVNHWPLRWKMPNVVDLPKSDQLCFLKNSARVRAQPWSLLLTVGYPKAAVGRSALINGSLCCWALI